MAPLASLEEANETADAETAETGAEPPLYNEISVPVSSIRGLSAVFIRSSSFSTFTGTGRPRTTSFSVLAASLALTLVKVPLEGHILSGS